MCSFLTMFSIYTGYYCIQQASTATPLSSATGDICPVGHYCPEGSQDKIPCPIGTHLDVEQQSAASDCKACPAGLYCSGVGLVEPSGNCSAEYYCPSGQNTSTPYEYR